jgi:23S rRNA pseudouridine1911/1915/1917 synthase
MDIIFENEDIVIVNKKAGVLVHPSHTSKDEKTVVDWFVEKYPDSRGVGEEQVLADGSTIARPGVVHRIDKDTSGVLVLAKTNEAYQHLKSQFQKREVVKTYLALVYGSLRFEELEIDRPISKHKKDFRRYTSKEGRGEEREAFTRVSVLKRFEKYTLLEVSPKTGRTHQIRVHLSDEGYPIVCDRLYGRGRVCPETLGRQALHAASISLVLPGDENMTTHTAPIPEDLKETIDTLALA